VLGADAAALGEWGLIAMKRASSCIPGSSSMLVSRLDEAVRGVVSGSSARHMPALSLAVGTAAVERPRRLDHPEHGLPWHADEHALW